MKNKPNGCRISDPCTCFCPLHALSLSTVRLGLICCVVDLVHVYENLTCSISTRLKSPENTWKMDINIWSWKVLENACKKVLKSHGKPLAVFSLHPEV